MKRYYPILSFILIATLLISCARAKGPTPESKRDYTHDMEEATLIELFTKKPETVELVESAEGYAVFSNINTQLLWFGSGHGFGVVHDNKTHEKTYMNMAEAGVGVGFSLKDFREVIIFNSREKMENFIESGWNVGSAQASAEFKYDDEGASAAAEGNMSTDIIVYQLTQKGISFRLNFGASKYWKNGNLNESK